MGRAKTFHLRLWKLVRNTVILFFVVSISWTILARFIPVYITPLMLIRTVESVFDGEKPKMVKRWVPIEKISPHMYQAVVSSEDNLFMKHNGFSMDAIKRAWNNNQKGRRLKGGSTISQQTAKNVFLWPQRSWVRKGLEAYFTILIELFWSKERIMEVYLNVIEMGDGIYGVQAASREYFGKDAAKLTKGQSALIAVCLPNPRRFNPARPSPYIQRRQGQIMRLMSKITRVDFNKKKKK